MDVWRLLRWLLDLWEALDPWALVTPQRLSRFLERNVRIPREDTSEVFAGAVLPAVEGILQGVHSRDKRFSASALLSGSYIEGLKVSEPDEFDFLVPLQGLPAREFACGAGVSLPAPPPDGACVPCRLRGRSSWDAGDVSLAQCQFKPWHPPLLCAIYRLFDDPHTLGGTGCGARLLSPDSVMGTFNKLVCDVTPSLKGSITVNQRKKGSPAVTLKILFKEKVISVDLVPLITKPFKSWTLLWPRQGQRWPSHDKIQKIKETGVDLAAKHQYYWRYSFSRVERVLLEAIDKDGGQRRNSLRILKKVRVDLWEPKFGKVLESYHLKTVLFWACEIYPYSNDWQNLAESFRRLVNLLLFFLLIGHLPHYFLSKDVNLLKAPKEDLTAVCKEVLTFKANAMNYFN